MNYPTTTKAIHSTVGPQGAMENENNVLDKDLTPKSYGAYMTPILPYLR